MLESVLRQVADRQPRRLDDLAGIGLVQPRENPQQRRLAGAVRAAQADTVAVGDLPGDVVEEDAIAERLREAGELNHEAALASGTPSARCAMATIRSIRNGFVK